MFNHRPAREWLVPWKTILETNYKATNYPVRTGIILSYTIEHLLAISSTKGPVALNDKEEYKMARASGNSSRASRDSSTRSAAFPSSPPLGILVVVRHFPAATPLCPFRRRLLPARRRDEMKPSISVIAAARRFFASAENASSGKRSRIPLTPSRLAPLLLAGLPTNRSPSPSAEALPPSCARNRGMLTRCSAPTFMEMHPLIYPASPACSRLCLTSVLAEVYYPARPLSPPLSRPLSIDALFPSPPPSPLPLLPFRDFVLADFAHDQPLPLRRVASSLARENHSNVISDEDRMLSSPLGAGKVSRARLYSPATIPRGVISSRDGGDYSRKRMRNDGERFAVQSSKRTRKLATWWFY